MRRWITRLVPFVLLLVVPFFVTSVVVFARQQQTESSEINCLALNIYHEARGEPLRGQEAVAAVTLNRVRSPYYPDTVCEVVYEKRWDAIAKREIAAFSWTLDKHSDEPKEVLAWQRSQEIAENSYRNFGSEPVVNNAMYFHSRAIRPSWASSKKLVAVIGRHRYYE